MAVIQRYQKTIQGALSITGNTLGLAGDLFGDGVLNFTTSIPSPNSGGTTTNWTLNSSAAFLTIPNNSTIDYAELTWASQYNSSISANLNSTITFMTPLGSNQIIPDPITAQTVTTQVGETFYVRSQNVTSIVSAAGAGQYIVQGIPSIISGGNAYVGWSLVVSYANQILSYSNITIWSLLQHIQGSFGNVTVPVNNLATPTTGNVHGRLVVTAGGGNPDLQGDFMKFGATESSLITLSGPNNLAGNFFASQINNNAGNLDTTGTWGTANTVPPNRAATGNRNSFDITNVSTSNGLTTSQTSALIIFGTVNDTYDALGLGLQVDVNAPQLTPIQKTASKNFANLYDVVTYTVSFMNKGQIAANNAMFVDTLPSSLTFNTGSFYVNGVQTTPSFGSPGLSLGSIAPNEYITITFSATINTLPSTNPILNSCDILYDFLPGIGLNTIPSGQNSNVVSTTVSNASLTPTKSASLSFADCGSIIIYSISIPNNGNVTAQNIVFKDTVPNGTILIPNSVYINGLQKIAYDPSIGITIPDISSGFTSTLSFSVKVQC